MDGRSDLAGVVLSGRYELREPIGAGGMAVVWRARDNVLARSVAVKIVTPERGEQTDIRREAQAAAGLSHPNIAQVHDYGEMTDGGRTFPYVVMELVEGGTLAERMVDGPVKPRQAMRVCAEIAAALAAAHAVGLVHRDIKPANVMLGPTGAKVVDFGIAAATAPSGSGVLDPEVLGTPAYLAPERLFDDAVEPASDVYALGVVLYRLLSGHSPWTSEDTTQMLTAHIYLEPAPLPPVTGVPGFVAELCERCLIKDPSRRPSAREASILLSRAAGTWNPDRATGAWTPTRAGGTEAPDGVAGAGALGAAAGAGGSDRAAGHTTGSRSLAGAAAGNANPGHTTGDAAPGHTTGGTARGHTTGEAARGHTTGGTAPGHTTGGTAPDHATGASDHDTGAGTQDGTTGDATGGSANAGPANHVAGAEPRNRAYREGPPGRAGNTRPPNPDTQDPRNTGPRPWPFRATNRGRWTATAILLLAAAALGWLLMPGKSDRVTPTAINASVSPPQPPASALPSADAAPAPTKKRPATPATATTRTQAPPPWWWSPPGPA
ncbi:MAG: serine/threonine-protein kinase, partial [Actinomycetota bacterium]|nr:serine/threonine-protein kinase [Actinomycetota bacterium]